jgi:hypothetical protein
MSVLVLSPIDSLCSVSEATGTDEFSYNFLLFSYINSSFWQEYRSACYLLHAGVLLGLFFNPEGGGDMFFQNVGCLSMGYMSQKLELLIRNMNR